ncbi:hypothetical protein F5890DRAFT_1559733 [Lentinula detonsa]|uniref:Uncharacterized protein n=1 Tax=Lentinula detonsa TaxID=2804962 RepID=A0AA38PN98_9AGAR|nr:hypothetical protein F5890DRAFT_1559733 [Lentinula detonsa]
MSSIVIISTTFFDIRGLQPSSTLQYLRPMTLRKSPGLGPRLRALQSQARALSPLKPSSKAGLFRAWGLKPSLEHHYSGLTFLSCLSMILTIGNTKYLTAENILAVSAFIDIDLVCCLIFVENNAPLHDHDQVIARKDMPYGPIGDTKEDYDVKQYDPNQENGRKLLEGGNAGNNLQSDAHLQDVFDILFYLSCIQDRKHKAKLFLPLQKFVHV